MVGSCVKPLSADPGGRYGQAWRNDARRRWSGARRGCSRGPWAGWRPNDAEGRWLMTIDSTRLAWAIAAASDSGGPRSLAGELLRDGADAALRRRWDQGSDGTCQAALVLAREMAERGVGAIVLGDPEYPDRLAETPTAPPLLFCWGNPALLRMPGVGMCGSRDVSERGLQA